MVVQRVILYKTQDMTLHAQQVHQSMKCLTLIQKRERPVTSSSGLHGQRFLTLGLPVNKVLFSAVGSEPSQQNATPVCCGQTRDTWTRLCQWLSSANRDGIGHCCICPSNFHEWTENEEMLLLIRIREQFVVLRQMCTSQKIVTKGHVYPWVFYTENITIRKSSAEPLKINR